MQEKHWAIMTAVELLLGYGGKPRLSIFCCCKYKAKILWLLGWGGGGIQKYILLLSFIVIRNRVLCLMHIYEQLITSCPALIHFNTACFVQGLWRYDNTCWRRDRYLRDRKLLLQWIMLHWGFLKMMAVSVSSTEYVHNIVVCPPKAVIV